MAFSRELSLIPHVFLWVGCVKGSLKFSGGCFFFFSFLHSTLFFKIKEKLLLFKMTEEVGLGCGRYVTLWL